VDVLAFRDETFRQMGKDDWLPLCEHVKEAEKEFWERDGIMDEELEQIMIDLG
jgi:hypothetical protein